MNLRSGRLLNVPTDAAAMFTPSPAAHSSSISSTEAACGPRLGELPSGRGSTIHQFTISAGRWRR